MLSVGVMAPTAGGGDDESLVKQIKTSRNTELYLWDWWGNNTALDTELRRRDRVHLPSTGDVLSLAHSPLTSP